MNAQVKDIKPIENMGLWSSVFTTDPIAVKPITGRPYKGSSPKPYWLIEQATKMFGPCGIGWGVEVVEQGFQQCGPDDVLHWATVKVWYEYQGRKGHVEQMGGTKAAYKTNAGKLMVDEDAAKKSVTDGMVKCLSMIGFAGDIFSGRWDDSKYVEQAEVHHNNIKLQDDFVKAVTDIQNASSESVLENAYRYFQKTEYKDMIVAECKAKKTQMGW